VLYSQYRIYYGMSQYKQQMGHEIHDEKRRPTTKIVDKNERLSRDLKQQGKRLLLE
jgi:hypothetical protein